MAERLTGLIRVDCAEVQGEGSYLMLRKLTYGEMRDILARGSGEKATVPFSEIAQHIPEWDWVNAKGEPLPAPSKDATVFEYLTDEEREFVSHAFFTGGKSKADSKNLESG